MKAAFPRGDRAICTRPQMSCTNGWLEFFAIILIGDTAQTAMYFAFAWQFFNAKIKLPGSIYSLV